jgi:hypothetical protein
LSADPLTDRPEATLIKVKPPGENRRLNGGSSIGGFEM